jgi:hypothetical protein
MREAMILLLQHVKLHFVYYVHVVMGNELDKIEQNGNETAKHPKISEEAGQQLQEEVKVCLFCVLGVTSVPVF